MHKKGILFTVTAVIMLIGLFTLSSTFMERTQELQRISNVHMDAEQVAYDENDVVGNAYTELLSTRLNTINTAGVTAAIRFNATQLSENISHRDIMQRYREFIEENYSLSDNINISLINFNNSFIIMPYNATFVADRNVLYLYSSPLQIKSIALSMVLSRDNDTKFEDSAPSGPHDVPVSVTYYDTEGDLIYSETQSLRADRDNDDGLGRQFYQSFEEMGVKVASIDTKFGTVNNTDGVLYIQLQGLTGNLSSFEVQYLKQDSPVYIKGGNISIQSNIGGISKNTEIILAEE